MSERILTTKEPAKRPVRPSTGVRNRLSLGNQDPNYVYRVVAVDNDSRLGRIEEMKAMGYDVVPGVDLGDNRADIGKGIGKTGIVSLGRGVTGVTMRIPKEWYNDFQKEKASAIQSSAEALKPRLET